MTQGKQPKKRRKRQTQPKPAATPQEQQQAQQKADTDSKAIAFIAAAQQTDVEGVVAEKLRQLLDLTDQSREDIEAADRTCFIDLAQMPPRVFLSGFWRGPDMRRAISSLKRAYHINRGVLRAKGVGAAATQPQPKKPLKGAAVITAKADALEAVQQEAIALELVQQDLRAAAAEGEPRPAHEVAPVVIEGAF